MLQWVRSRGAPWNAITLARAARWGHLELVKWARLNGCNWDGRVTSRAARWGHADLVIWAAEHGCPVSITALRAAACQPWGQQTCTLAIILCVGTCQSPSHPRATLLALCKRGSASWHTNAVPQLAVCGSGTPTHPRQRRWAATWPSCSMRTSTAAPGTQRPAPAPRAPATSRCCAGRARTAAR